MSSWKGDESEAVGSIGPEKIIFWLLVADIIVVIAIGVLYVAVWGFPFS